MLLNYFFIANDWQTPANNGLRVDNLCCHFHLAWSFFSSCFPGSFILLQTHIYFVSTVLEQKPLVNAVSPTAQWNSLPSDIHHIQSSHAFKTALKTLQTIPQVISNSVFLLASPFHHPSPLATSVPSVCLCVCLCMCACACVCVRACVCARNTILWL